MRPSAFSLLALSLPLTALAFNEDDFRMPGAPTDLSSGSVTTSSLKLRWTDNSANEHGFRIYRSSGGSAFALVATVERNVVEHTDANLRDNTVYSYYVTAFDSQGQTPASNTAEVKTVHGKFSIRGRVVDANYYPIAGATVRLSHPEGYDLLKEVTPNLAIPDKSSVQAQIAVSEPGSILGMEVGIDIRHTYIGDLNVSLAHPDGTTVVLHNNTGSSADNLNVVYPRTATPYQSLDAFKNKAYRGNWTVKVTDSAGSDVGTLVKVSLRFRTVGYQPNMQATTNAEGIYVLPDVLSGSYRIEAVKDSYNFGAPRNLLLDGHKNAVHFVSE